jgi:hypothetical protein
LNLIAPMTLQQILGTALRLVAIWLILIGFQLHTMTIWVSQQFPGDLPAFWGYIALLPCMMAVFLWMFPMLTANKLLPRRAEQDRTTPGDLLALAAVMFGLWAVVGSIAGIFSALSIAVVSRGTPFFDDYMRSPSGGGHAAITAAQYLMGLVLMGAPRLFSRLIFAPHVTRADN